MWVGTLRFRPATANRIWQAVVSLNWAGPFLHSRSGRIGYALSYSIQRIGSLALSLQKEPCHIAVLVGINMNGVISAECTNEACIPTKESSLLADPRSNLEYWSIAVCVSPKEGLISVQWPTARSVAGFLNP